MAKPGSAAASDDEDEPTTTAYNTVFIDSNLDTHLAMIVSDVETVSDFKKKILFEHPQCFPNIGEIKIDALKVKRKGYFYHLSDSMLVKSAFEGIKKNWFLFLDASNATQKSECRVAAANASDDRNNLLPEGLSKKLAMVNDLSSLQPGSSQQVAPKILHANQFLPENFNSVLNHLEMETGCIGDGNSKRVSSDTNKELESEVQDKYDPLNEDLLSKDLVLVDVGDTHCGPSSSNMSGRLEPEIQENCNPISEELNVHARYTESNDVFSKNGIDDLQCNNSAEKTGSVGNEKHKVKKKKKKNEAGEHIPNLKQDNGASQPENIVPENSYGGSGIPMKMRSTQIDDEPCTTPPSKTRKRLDSQTQQNCVPSMGNRTDSLGETAASRPTRRKRKHKIENENCSESLLDDCNTLTSTHTEGTSNEKAIVPRDFLEYKQENKNVVINGLCTESSMDADLFEKGSGNRKKKRRKNSENPCNQVGSPVSSPKRPVSYQDSMQKVQVHHGNLSAKFGAANNPGQIVQGATVEPCAVVPEETLRNPVQEVVEGDAVPCFPLGIVTKERNAGNSESRCDVSESPNASVVKRNSEVHQAVSAEVLTPPAVKESEILNDVVILSGQTDNVEGRELPQSPKEISSERCDNAGHQRISRAVDSSEIPSSDTVKGNSQGRLYKAKASENEVEEALQITDVSEPEDPSSAKNLRNKGEKNSNVATADLPRLPIKEHDISTMDPVFPNVEMKKIDTPSKTTKKIRLKISSSKTGSKLERPNKETGFLLASSEQQRSYRAVHSSQIPSSDSIQGNSQERLQAKASESKVEEALKIIEVSEPQENAENMDGKLRKKSKKHRIVAAELFPGCPMKEDDISAKNPVVSNDKKRKMDKSISTKKTRPKNTSVITGSNLENSYKETGMEFDSSHHPRISGADDHSQSLSSHAIEDNSRGGPHDAMADDNVIMNGQMDGNKNLLDTSVCESDRVNFNDYFVSSQSMHEVAPTKVLVDEVTTAKRLNRKRKSKKDSKKHDVPTAGVTLTPNLQTMHESNEEQGSDKMSEEGNLARVLPKESLSNSRFTPLSNKKSSNVSGVDFKVPSCNGVRVDSVPKESIGHNVIHSSGAGKSASSYRKQSSKESNEASTLSRSSFEDSRKLIHKRKRSKSHRPLMDNYPATAVKPPRKNIRKGLNSLEHKKSLVARSGGIFKDYSSGSSKDEDGVENSDASTRTPSDNLSSAGNSVGTSDGSVDSLDNGANAMKRKEQKEKDIKKSISSGAKNMKLDMILRSSSRYKKAKLTASQSQLEDTESEP